MLLGNLLPTKKEKKMRTLTKEQVNTDLIGDGPSEVLARKLNIIYEKTDREELQTKFKKNFLVQLSNTLKIDGKNAIELLSSLDGTAVGLLEKRVTSRCRIWAWFEKTFWSAWSLLWLMSLFKFFGEGISLLLFWLCLSVYCFVLTGSFICLMDDGSILLTGCIRYMKNRKKLIKTHGMEYFLLPGLLR